MNDDDIVEELRAKREARRQATSDDDIVEQVRSRIAARTRDKRCEYNAALVMSWRPICPTDNRQTPA